MGLDFFSRRAAVTCMPGKGWISYRVQTLDQASVTGHAAVVWLSLDFLWRLGLLFGIRMVLSPWEWLHKATDDIDEMLQLPEALEHGTEEGSTAKRRGNSRPIST
jgi:hypothetical protein